MPSGAGLPTIGKVERKQGEQAIDVLSPNMLRHQICWIQGPRDFPKGRPMSVENILNPEILRLEMPNLTGSEPLANPVSGRCIGLNYQTFGLTKISRHGLTA